MANMPRTTTIKPLIKHRKALAKAIQLRDHIPGCNLSDECVALVALRANSTASTAQIARQLGLKPHDAYVMLGRHEAQELLAQLAKTVLGSAALMGAATMTRLMGSKDAHIAYKAADAMMERAGLGISTRSTNPSVAPATVFSFSFGQAAEPHPSVAARAATDGTHSEGGSATPASKNEASVSGEGASEAILQPGEISGADNGELSRMSLKGTRFGGGRRINSLKAT